MAVTEITPTDISLDTAQAFTQGTGTAINESNTMEIPYPKQGKLLILIDSDHADTEATFTASDFGVAKGLGDLAVAIGDTAMKAVILSSDRLLQSKGDGDNTIAGVLEISWATNSAGFVQAYNLP